MIVFAVNGGDGIFRVAESGGAARLAMKGQSYRYPWFLPDGRHFLCTSVQAADMPVRVGSLDEPQNPGKVVAQTHSAAVYAQGHLLYLRENTLMAQPFDVDQLTTRGEATPVVEGVATFTGAPSRIPGFAVSTRGLLVYASGASGVHSSKLVWKNRQGEVLGSLGEPTDSIGSIALSPDAKRVAVNSASDAVLWIYDVARGIPTRFTFDPGNHREPIWSPDGNVLYFSSDRKGAIDLYRKASNGTGSEEILLEDSSSKAPDSVSSDGKLLLYTRIDDLPTLWVLPLVSSPSGRKTESHVFPQTPSNERRRGQFSPDGTWVVYQSAVSGQIQVYAAPFPGPGGTRQISTGAGFFPLWRKDGREIYYVTPDGQLMATEVAVRNGSLEMGRTQKLFDGIVTTRGRLYDVSADGQKFLVVDDGVTPSAQPLTLLQNWMATLRK